MRTHACGPRAFAPLNLYRAFRAGIGESLNFRYWQILLQKSAPADGRSANSFRSDGFDPPIPTLSTQLLRYAMHRASAGGGRATSDASRRRFWAMAARTNASWAPRGPRSRSRPSFRMRFKCANRISIFLLSRRDCSKPSVLASERATSRACSWMSRGILRDGSFGLHCGLSGHTSQSSLLARYKSVLPSCTVPLVPSYFPPGQR
jgi:hypothetical protein